MKIHLNGNPTEISGGLTLKTLLESYKINPKTVVIERNLRVVPITEIDRVAVIEGDRIEIVQFVGGGSAQ